MISVLFGLLAALCWSTHDLLARRFAAETGPFRMSFWIMLAGGLLLIIPVLWRGQIWNTDSYSLAMALAMGVGAIISKRMTDRRKRVSVT